MLQAIAVITWWGRRVPGSVNDDPLSLVVPGKVQVRLGKADFFFFAVVALATS